MDLFAPFLADDAFSGDYSAEIFSAPVIWLQYSDNVAKQEFHHQNLSYKAKNQGYSIGLSSSLEEDDSLSTDLFYTQTQGDIHNKSYTSKLDTKDHIFGINTLWREDNFFFLGQMQYSSGKYHGYQNSDPLGYDSHYRGFNLTAGYTYELGLYWQWQPWASFNRYSVKTNSITSSSPHPVTPYWDSPINKKYRIKEASGGVKLLGQLSLNKVTLRPEFGISGFHNFKDDPVEVTASFGHAGTCFLINTANNDHERYAYDLTLNFEYESQRFLSLNYSRQWSDSFKVGGFIAIMRYEF